MPKKTGKDIKVARAAKAAKAAKAAETNEVVNDDVPVREEIEYVLQPMCTNGEPLVINSNMIHVPRVLNNIIKQVYGKSLQKLSIGPPPEYLTDDPKSMVDYLDEFSKAIKEYNLTHRKPLKIAASEWNRPKCTLPVAEKIIEQTYALTIPKPKQLNKHYETFTSEVYGETNLPQMSAFLDYLNLTEKDVVVDLGSGVGQLVLFTSAYSKVSKVVGIEISDYPAACAKNMGHQFRNLMRHYGKEISPFELHRGSFLDETFRNLITKEATVIFINNFAFSVDLMASIMKLLENLDNGVRVITSKKFVASSSTRRAQAADFSCLIETTELPIVTSEEGNNVSWTSKCVQFYLNTVDLEKPFKDRIKAEQKAEKMKQQRKMRRENKENGQIATRPPTKAVKRRYQTQPRQRRSKKMKVSVPSESNVSQTSEQLQFAEVAMEEERLDKPEEVADTEVSLQNEQMTGIKRETESIHSTSAQMDTEEKMTETLETPILLSEIVLEQKIDVNSEEIPLGNEMVATNTSMNAPVDEMALEEPETHFDRNKEVKAVVEKLKTDVEKKEKEDMQEQMELQLEADQEHNSEISSRVTTPDTATSISDMSEYEQGMAADEYMTDMMHRQTEMVY
ncbi:hypothetical protein GCK72_023119 [Caenorhabditis remanei]|uniref:Histone-lysine N-methyltransferase, H3 lysine-79 specific n=1 Tax=Caenorhabditis remanei TaxID=31234 RepID=A0A6A5FVV8_CAERE|nr:hypothetical protein GCK72_023119 [Caenorhabditis remanei]KAF1746662.1 hypothetical protein GCK72_023119 [Caenorhabditis remanei]